MRRRILTLGRTEGGISAHGVLVPQAHDPLARAQGEPDLVPPRDRALERGIGRTIGSTIELAAHVPLMTAVSVQAMRASRAPTVHDGMIIGHIGLVVLMRDQTDRTMRVHVETLEAVFLLAEAHALVLDSHGTKGALALSDVRIVTHALNEEASSSRRTLVQREGERVHGCTRKSGV